MSSPRPPMILGLDIGYSSVKLAFGSGAQPALRTLKVGAAPRDRFHERGDGVEDAMREGAFDVLIKGQPWLAGADPGAITSYTPVMTDDFASTDEYLALFYAALLATESEHISHLVIGLPVKHYQDKDKVAALKKRLQGLHTINHSRSATVDTVMVVPQPAGACADAKVAMAANPTAPRFGEDSVTVAVDPGHMSFDWCVFMKGLNVESSGSTVESGEKILEKTVQNIRTDENLIVGLGKLENAIRSGSPFVQAGIRQIDYDPALQKAIEQVMPANIRAMANALRRISAEQGVDLVVLAGGAAAWAEGAIHKNWPRAFIYRSVDPTLANARGFWWLGKKEAARR